LVLSRGLAEIVVAKRRIANFRNRPGRRQPGGLPHDWQQCPNQDFFAAMNIRSKAAFVSGDSARGSSRLPRVAFRFLGARLPRFGPLAMIVSLSPGLTGVVDPRR
jgi:hypothetical protein